jgi:hypothetical protein
MSMVIYVNNITEQRVLQIDMDIVKSQQKAKAGHTLVVGWHYLYPFVELFAW